MTAIFIVIFSAVSVIATIGHYYGKAEKEKIEKVCEEREANDCTEPDLEEKKELGN